MKRHASMNRAFRLIWSAARGACIVAPETARGRGRAACSTAAAITGAHAAAGLCAALALAGPAGAQSPPATVLDPPAVKPKSDGIAPVSNVTSSVDK